MKERPILFNDEMVRAVLDGIKTETRRPITPQPTFEQLYVWRGKTVRDSGSRSWCWRGHDLGEDLWDWAGGPARTALAAMNPFGVAGDKLWVRECFAPFVAPDGSGREGVAFRASCVDGQFTWVGDDGGGSLSVAAMQVARWRPSIHMPREDSRILLDVRAGVVERLQEVSAADAYAEGFADRASFIAAWDQIYPAFPSAKNPWVWVTKFERSQS